MLEYKWKNVIKTNDGYVLVDTDYILFVRCWETTVLKCDKNGNVKSWHQLDINRYFSRHEAEVGHMKIVDIWKNC